MIDDENLEGEMCELYRDIGIFAHESPVLQVVDRIEEWAPRLVHPTYGASFEGDMLPSYVEALRTEPFAFQGSLFGQSLPHGSEEHHAA